MNSPPSSLPPFHTWLTLILMPGLPEYQSQLKRLEHDLAEVRQEAAQLLGQLDTATDESQREALLKALTEAKIEVKTLTQQIAHLHSNHRDRN